MAKIKRLIIENFQSHKYTDIYLNEGFNVITGESDNGKSAMLRALRWVYFNQPRGSDFIRVNQNECRVHVVLDHDYTVVRERTPSKNRYIEIDPEGEKTIYEGFGSNVPEEIKKRLGIYDINIDNDITINLILQEQLEGEFLLDRTYTGSIKAKTIGRVYSVHYIDSAIRDILKDENRVSMEIKRLEQDIEDIQNNLEQFNYLAPLENKLNSIFKNIQKIEQLQAIQTSLEKYRSWYKDVDSKIHQNSLVVDKLADIDKAEEQLDNVEKRYDYYRMLLNLKKEYNSTNSRIQENIDILENIKNTHMIETNLGNIRAMLEKHQGLTTNSSYLVNIKTEIKSMNNILSTTKHLNEAVQVLENISRKLVSVQKIQSAKKEYDDCTKRLKNIQLTLEKTHNIDSADKDYSKLKAIMQQAETLKQLKQKLENQQKRIHEQQIIIKNKNADIENKLKQYKQLLLHMGKCPTCFSSIDNITVERIIKEFR
ncbi:MAG: AAA family ATPase [Clostridia bacterium]|nr:AAA family ATPase [Clostridia bacterium]